MEVLENVDDRDKASNNLENTDNANDTREKSDSQIYLEQKARLNNVDSKCKRNEQTRLKINDKKDREEDADETVKKTSKKIAEDLDEIIPNLNSGVHHSDSKDRLKIEEQNSEITAAARPESMAEKSSQWGEGI